MKSASISVNNTMLLDSIGCFFDTFYDRNLCTIEYKRSII